MRKRKFCRAPVRLVHFVREGVRYLLPITVRASPVEGVVRSKFLAETPKRMQIAMS